jgi:crossover junction endodeoxyribonuclease RuvC
LIILGVDPGTNTLGYGVVEFLGNRYQLLEAGTLEFKNKNFKESVNDVKELLNILNNKYKIDSIAIEDIFLGFNPQSLIKLAQFRGAILYIASEQFEIIGEYSPREVKKALTSNGNSTKEQVQFMIFKILNIKNIEKIKLDISDALAIAITHIQHIQYLQIRNLAKI